MTTDIPYQEIVDRLNMRAAEVASQCIPNGKREGIYWRGDLNGKISVHISGGRVGTVGFWQGQGGNAKGGGNLVDLIALAFDCPSHGVAVKFAKERFLGIGPGELSAEEKARFARQQEESRRRAAQRAEQDARRQEIKVQTVRSVWRESVPIIGTPAEEYLKSRDIEISDFPEGETLPSLRFHPSLTFGGGTDTHPALVAGVQDATRRLVALWRIFLQPNGKALLGPNGKKIKMGFGPSSGGAVRLAPVGPVLRVAEGIETALAVMLLTGCRVPVWATLSTSGMTGFQIPAGVRRIEVYADADRFRESSDGRVLDPPGMRAAAELCAKAAREGLESFLYPSPEPDDWLDVYQAFKRDKTTQRTVGYLD